MRISKYFSQQKILSRRETERYILGGRIKVNGEIVKDLGRQIDPEKDKVEIVGEVKEKTTILFNKPRGISSSRIASEGESIFDLLPQYKHLNAIGRLDKESEGIILLSNDGPLTNIITGQEHLIEKEYLVEVREKVSQTQMNALSQGMMLNDGPTLPAKAQIINDHTFSIILREGRNHQIRRMANQVRFTINKLIRVRIGKLTIDGLRPGEYRPVTIKEIEALKSRATSKTD
jgi:23S rRNA pseudouridine2605 synthase